MKNRSVGFVILALALAVMGGRVLLAQQVEPYTGRLPVKSGNELLDVFAGDGAKLITRPEHLGIVSDMTSVGISHDYVGVLDGLWAIPYVSSDFYIEPMIFGERIKSDHYTWLPFQTNRIGQLHNIEVISTTSLLYGQRAGVLTLKFRNTGAQKQEVPIQLVMNDPFTYRVSLDKEPVWGFSRPKSKTPVRNIKDVRGIVRVQGDYAVAIGSDLQGLWWEEPTRRFHGQISLGPNEEATMSVVFAIGEKDDAIRERDVVLGDIAAHVDAAQYHYITEVKNIFSRLPRFSSDNKALEQLYNRSLSIFITNKFNVPEFVVNPYYGTGAVKGGCTVNYLWNFGQVFQIMHLLDPEDGKAHIVKFIQSGGLANGYAFYPLTGESTGTWYMVNQEKIIRHVYNYVKLTGDTDFLNFQVEPGKSILDVMVESAMLLDDPSKPVKLVDYGVDYGAANSHLELRREFRYNHVMPDMNGRRYNNYVRVSELCKLMGKPMPLLMKRAAQLKEVLKRELWNPELDWFMFVNGDGKKDVRYTVQMYKLFDSDVIDEEIKQGLLSHLNEKEFLSDFGLHSMSKLDPAYDQVDIDNGGGGNCTSFTALISGFLYQDGRTEIADQILGSILWWGTRMPYFSDSQYATHIGYRLDTPLQSNISTGALAQTILFGLFGIDVAFDGTLTINPVNTRLAKNLNVTGLKVRDKTVDIAVDGDHYTVTSGGKTWRKEIGTATVVRK